ncbi:MAG: hypothetical protein ACKVOR_01680 [Flavobacteriales bacterium]
MPTQATVTAASSVEVFRFVNMRAPQLPKPGMKAERFITHDFYAAIPSGTISAIEANGKILHAELLPTVSNTNPRTAAEAEVTKFRNGTNGYVSANYYNSVSSLYGSTAPFHKYDLILEMWQTANGRISGANFITECETILGTTVAAHLTNATERKVRLWDNVMSAYVTPDISAIRQHYLWCLRIMNALEKISANASAYPSSAVYRLFKATVVLPKPVFPLPKVLNTITETTTQPTNSAQTAMAVAKTEYLSRLEAIRELRKEVEWKRAVRKAQFPQACQLPLEDLTFTRNIPDVCSLADLDPANHMDFISLATAGRFLSSTTLGLVRALTTVGTHSILVSYAIRQLRLDALMWAGKAGLGNGAIDLMLVGNSLVPLADLCRSNPEIVACDPYTGATLPVGSGHVRPIGVTDHLSVKQELLKYAEGEIAHVENIMATEIKRRTHRDLMRSELTTTSESSSETEEMKDVQTTERFSVQSEASQIVQSDQQQNANIGVGYSIGNTNTGLLNINGTAGFASNNSQQNASSNGVQAAKDVVERAVNRVVEKTRNLRQSSIIREVEDTTEHGFKNDGETSSHVVGQYHWLDKYYLCKLINRGKRMMFEFMVPEPAAFHIYSKAVGKPEGSIVQKPIAPDDEFWDETLTSPEQLNYDNYDRWAARYGVQEMPPPPSEHITFGYAKSINSSDGDVHSDIIELPEGYEALNASVRFFYKREGSSDSWLHITVGNQSLFSMLVAEGSQTFLDLDNEVGTLPVTIANQPTTYANVAISIKCAPTANAFSDWQLKAYTAIIQAYEIKLDEYNRKLAAITGVNITGQNPLLNRKTEQEELKRGCLELFTDQKWSAFDAMRNWQGPEQYPQFSNTEARGEGNYVKFFEQGFEWSEMSYIFYPYFWGRKKNWVTIKNIEDPDPLFSRFLQSGFARVVVPVRPGFEEALLHYCDTGQIWNGDDVPTIEDDMYLSIIDEIRAQEEIVGDENLPVVGEPWIIKVPTNLVRLNASTAPTLPDFSADLLEEE